MTPGARLEAAIGLLAAIGEGRAAADDLVAEYFRRHRFAGAKDRAAISRHIYGVLRRRGASRGRAWRFRPAPPMMECRSWRLS